MRLEGKTALIAGGASGVEGRLMGIGERRCGDSCVRARRS